MSRGICQFCRRRVATARSDGAWEFLVPVIPYQGKSYCASPCFDKLRAIAQRTGGQL